MAALSDAAYYLCSLVPTIADQRTGLPAVLAELGFLYIPATSAAAVNIKSDPSAFQDGLSKGVFSLRVGVGRELRDFYMYRYYTGAGGRKRYCVRGDAHEKGAGGHAVGISISRLGEWWLVGWSGGKIAPSIN